MKILGFDHVTICAKDPKVLADWYIDNFGFSFRNATEQGVYYVEGPDQVMLEITPPTPDSTLEAPAPTTIGWKHIALVPADFDAAVEEVKALGIPYLGEPTKRDDGYCAFFFKDPDGNMIHFAKWADDRGMYKK